MQVSLTGTHKKEKKCKIKVICEIKDIEKKEREREREQLHGSKIVFRVRVKNILIVREVLSYRLSAEFWSINLI